MKKYKKLLFALAMALPLMTQTGCTDGFAELNTNPKSLLTVKPEQMFYTAETQYLTAAHCWNSIYASKYRWMQYGAGIWGYDQVQYNYFSNSIGDYIYYEYNNIGSYVTNIAYLASISENPAKYTALNAVGRIMLIAKGIQASDLYGSLAYSTAWQARNGKVDEADLFPTYQSQEELVGIWDRELKQCIADLKAAGSDQVSLKGYDRSYNGDLSQWVKAANGIRLRIASRIWKRKPDVAKNIAAEVLAVGNASNIMENTDDSFIFWFDNLYTNINGGDWHSVVDMEIATRCLMTYLVRNEDPRKRFYFRINNLTPENIEAFNKLVELPKNVHQLIPEDFTRWEGVSASRDDWPAASANYDRRYTSYGLPKNGVTFDMRPANKPQVRLWKGGESAGGGGNWAPVMTYADFCFLAAEFVLTDHVASGKTAQQWYEDGVKASLDQWNAIGKFCDLHGYSPMTQEEIDAFLDKEDIKWDDSKALEQICAQRHVEYYKNVDEAWAQWKRTGYPNTTSTILKFDQPVINGVDGVIPRRVKFVYPFEGVHNYTNLKKRLDEMKKDPQFGDPNSEFGRVWWDVE